MTTSASPRDFLTAQPALFADDWEAAGYMHEYEISRLWRGARAEGSRRHQRAHVEIVSRSLGL
jgi:hypothetical protein